MAEISNIPDGGGYYGSDERRGGGAKQFNTKLVLLVVLILAVLGIIIGCAWFWAVRRSPARYEEMGNAAYSRGDYRSALPNYGRALSLTKDRAGKISLIKKVISTLGSLPAEKDIEAYNFFQGILALREELAKLNPGDTESMRLLLDDYFQIAIGTGANGAWEALRAKTEKMVAAAPENPVALKYDGIANVVWMARFTMEQKRRDEIRTRLEAARKALPEDKDLALYLATWYVNEARLRKGQADHGEMVKLLGAAKGIMSAYVAAHPANMGAKLENVRVLLEAGSLLTQPQAADRPDEWNLAVRLAAEAEKQMLAGDYPELAENMAVILRTSDISPLTLGDGTATTNGNERAIAVLNHLLALHADRQDILYNLGCIYRATKRQNAAVDAFAKAAKGRPPVIGPAIQKQRNLQINSLYGLIDILLEQYSAEPELAAQAKLLARIKGYLTEYQLLATATPELDMLEGRVALAEDKQWEALDKLDAADARSDRKSPDVAYMAGSILGKLGQHAAAAQRYSAVFAIPNTPPDLRVKAAKATAGEFVRMMLLDDATNLVQSLNKALPNNPDVHLLMAEVLMERSRAVGPIPTHASLKFLWQAVSLVKPWADQGNAAAQKRLAEIYLRLGDDDQARNVLRDYVRADPADVEQLARLIVLEQRTALSESAAERIARALAGAPPGRAADLVRAAIAAKQGPCWSRLGDILLIALEPSSIKRELQLAEFARGTGMDGEAEQAVARAKALAPQNPQLLRFLFENALAAGKPDAAQSIIEQGEAVEMDSMDILLWKARLSLAKGDSRSAATILDEVTRRRPLFSDGWRLLGMARLLQGNAGEAEADFRKALEMKPDNLAALQELFRLSNGDKQYAKALDTLRQMLRFRPDDPALLDDYLNYLGLYGDKGDALRLRQQLVVLVPGNLPNRRALARLCVETNSLAEAQAELDVLAKTDPDNRDNAVTAALLEQARNRPQEGRRKLEEYLAHRGAKADMEDRLCLARFLRRIQAAPEETLAAYAKILPLQDPKTMPVTLEVADWQASRGGSAEALVLYREFRDKTGNHSVCPAIVDLLMRRSQYEEAQKELDIWRKATAPAVDSRQAIASALLLGERGKAAQAAEVVTAALKKDPDNASLYLVRAQIFFNDRTKEDIQAQVKLDLEKAVELGPSLSRPRELLQEWLLRELRFDEAVSQLMRLIEMRPSNPQYRLQLAQVYMRQERQDALAQLLAESIRLVDVPVWHQMRATMLRGKGDLDAAVRELATAYRMQKQPAAESVAQYAEALVDTKQAPEALALIAKHPDALKTSPLLNALYGRALAATDKAYAADASFAEAIRMASDNDNLMEGVVGQLQNLESPAATVRRLEQAGKSHPTVVLDVAVAKVLLQDGQTEAAQKILERIADSGSLAKDDVSIRPVVYWLQASLCHSTKQNVKARAAYEALLRMQPNNMAALNNLAILLADDMNLPEEALPLVMKAASNWRINDAERANVLDSLGHVQFLANRLPESIITFGRSLSLKDNVLTRVHMAEALAKQQRLVEARNELQRAQQTAQREHADKALLQQIAALLKSLDVPGSGAGAVSRSTASYLNEPDFLKKGAKSSSGFSGPPPAKGASPTESPAAANPPARGRSVFDEPEFLKKEGVPPAGPAAPLPPPPAPKAGA